MTASRRMRRWLTGPLAVSAPLPDLLSSATLARAETVVRMTYVAAAYVALSAHDNWSNWARNGATDLLWPVTFIDHLPKPYGGLIVVGAAVLGPLAAAARPDLRATRSSAAVGMFLYAALWNSKGWVMHGLHGWTWALIVLVALPPGDVHRLAACRWTGQRYLRVVWAAQAFTLLLYSLSGMAKLTAGVVQLSRGEHSLFHPDALARHTALRLATGATPDAFSVGHWLVNHPAAGWPLLPIAVYLELFALVAAFRPRLHRTWGLSLVAMQGSIYFVMTILFSWQMLLIGVLLVCSPFAPRRTTWRELLLSLPLVGDALFVLSRRRR